MSTVSFINSRGGRLVGVLRDEGPDAVVVLAHGFLSDKSSQGRFDYISRCLNRAGFSTFAFDFSGCGESQDDALTLAKLVDDLECAVREVRRRGYPRVALWGHSLGTRVCVSAQVDDVFAMVLTGAGIGPVHHDWDTFLTPAQRTQLATTGRATFEIEDGPRRTAVIERQMVADFSSMDQRRTLSRLASPTLIIHGDGDDEEVMLAKISRAGIRHLPNGSRIVVLPGAGHGFFGYIDRVIHLGRGWLTKHAAPFTPRTLDGKAR